MCVPLLSVGSGQIRHICLSRRSLARRELDLCVGAVLSCLVGGTLLPYGFFGRHGRGGRSEGIALSSGDSRAAFVLAFWTNRSPSRLLEA